MRALTTPGQSEAPPRFFLNLNLRPRHS